MHKHNDRSSPRTRETQVGRRVSRGVDKLQDSPIAHPIIQTILCEKISDLGTVVFLFLFDKYYLIMN